ncbi:MAG TPA: SUMF1/EgtB/PvdO family nonheme iron enzyme [Thermoanaerobaculia bacterium]
MRHPAFAEPVSREQLVDWYRSTRARSQRIFSIPLPECYYERPISLRNPIVFYEGHIPAFAVNTFVKRAFGKSGINAEYEVLFERGIDPDDEKAVRNKAAMWPSREAVQSYGAAANTLIERMLLETDLAQISEPAFTIIEHELMHQETLLYMMHNLPYDKKKRQSTTVTTGGQQPANSNQIKIPAGTATLGATHDQLPFGWDNEFPSQTAEVGDFAIGRYKVTNGQYLDYMNSTDASPPHFWLRRGGQWFWRGMFELVPLPLDWPVYATHDEAEAYARWLGQRLPSEAEYHRAAFGTPAGEERLHPWGDAPADKTRGNFDFAHWDPVPAGSYPAGASAWGVHDLVGNGWEWTSSHFDGFPGFQPMPLYPVYSTDFFDNQHFVMKGASPATARELVRRTFRNWFRPNYPYVYATFRCVS